MSEDLRQGPSPAYAQNEHALLQAREQPPQQTDLLVQLPDINDVFAHDAVEQIHQALEERGDAWAQQTLNLMHRCAGAHAMQGSMPDPHAVSRKVTQATATNKCCRGMVPKP